MIWPRRANRLLEAAVMAVFLAGAALLAAGVWIPVKASAAQVLIRLAWQRERRGATAVAPWPWADTRPVAKLSFGRSAGSSSLYVLEGSSGRNLAFGPVHDSASVAPGALGNSVIEGHRDTHFKILSAAKRGDQLTLETLDGVRSVFVVTDVRVVDSRRTHIVLDADVARLTLATCYPFEAVVPGGPLRWVVTADRVAPRE